MFTSSYRVKVAVLRRAMTTLNTHKPFFGSPLEAIVATDAYRDLI